MSFLLAVLMLGSLIALHEFGHYMAARICGIPVSSFAIGFGPTLLSWRLWDTNFKLNILPFGGYVSFPSEDEDDEKDSLSQSPALAQAFVAAAGVFMNMVIAFVLLLIVGLSDGVLTQSDGAGAHVINVVANSPAAKVGILPEDVVTSVGLENQALARVTSVPVLIDYVQNKSQGRALHLRIKRNDAHMDFILKPVLVQTDQNSDARYDLGIGLNYLKIRRLPFTIAVMNSAIVTGDMLHEIVVQMPMTLLHVFKTADTSQVSGPVGIVAASASSASVGTPSLLFLGALISVSLAVFNTLPFPGLDGWRLLNVLIKVVIGREMPARVNMIVSMVGLILLLSFGVLVTISDLKKLFG